MNLKKLMEKRAILQASMQALLDGAEAEERAMSEEEEAKFGEYEKEISGIDRTIAAFERMRNLNQPEQRTGEAENNERQEEAEERAFSNYIRGITEERADVNLNTGDNGAVIPASIANKIIKKVHDICPIYQLATKYPVGGSLSIPYYDEDSGDITMTYAEEFNELESTAGKFKSITLKGFLAGALSKISKSLINNSSFNITGFVIERMAWSIARWIENEMLNGTADKIEGISKATQVVSAAASAAVTADELIDLQEEVPDMYQPDCIWVMNKATRTAIRKLKDNDGNYILNKDATSRWGYTLFGNDVYCSDNISKMEAGKTAIAYGDFSGLAVKLAEDMNIEVLREKFATQHAVGVVGWLEMDAKIENEQKIAVLKMKASA